MAKKKATNANGVNKSNLIRQYKEKHPSAGPKEISEALASHKVSYGLVASVLTKEKAKGKKKAGHKTKKAPTAHSNGHAAKGNGHATAFVHSAFNLGLDTAIELLQKVKKAVG